MIVLLDTSAESLKTLAEEHPHTVGQLASPLTNYALWPGPYAADNGCFARFDPDAYRRMLSRLRDDGRALWVTAPDVVGSARRTMETFRAWYPELEGLPIALVAQDGMEDLEVPWGLLSALFIGGTDAWKESHAAEALVKAAQLMEKRTHVGRVNMPRRAARCREMGVDSIDGSGLVRFKHMLSGPFWAAVEGQEYHPLLDGLHDPADKVERMCPICGGSTSVLSGGPGQIVPAAADSSGEESRHDG